MDTSIYAFSTDLKYAGREDKPKYVWSKYRDILKGRILDVGADRCGLREFLPPGTEYTGIGLGGSVDMEINLEKEAIPFEENSSDCVLCLDVLEHLDNIHDVFDKLCAITNKYLIVSLPNPYKSFTALLTRGYYDAERPIKFYNLPVNKPEDRHKWFFGIEEAERFITERGKMNGMDVIHVDKQKTVTIKTRLLYLFAKLFIHRGLNKYNFAYVSKIWAVLEKRD